MMVVNATALRRVFDECSQGGPSWNSSSELGCTEYPGPVLDWQMDSEVGHLAFRSWQTDSHC